MTINAQVKTIAVISCTKAEYIAHIEKDLIPILEQYHGIKFLRNHADDSFRSFEPSPPGTDMVLYTGFKIFRCRKADDLKGLGPYQLVKVGKFHNHPELDAIEEVYSLEVRRRMKERSPVHGA